MTPCGVNKNNVNIFWCDINICIFYLVKKLIREKSILDFEVVLVVLVQEKCKMKDP